MATISTLAVNEVLAAERSVVAIEPILDTYYQSAEDEVISILKSFYNQHAVNDRISFAVLRRHLSAIELKRFQAQLQTWHDEHSDDEGWHPFMSATKKLISRKKLTYLDQVTAELRHAVEVPFLLERNAYTSLANTNIMAAYYLRAFDTAKVNKAGIQFEPITQTLIDNIRQYRWDDSKVYGNYYDRSRNWLDVLLGQFDTLLPQAIAAANNTKNTTNQLTKRIQVIKGHERQLIRTEINEVINGADNQLYKVMGLDMYRFNAILDEVTTEICRSLNGKEFRLSEAQVHINYPPMHTNCRSTTEPVLEGYTPSEEVLTLLRSNTLEEFVRQYALAEQVEPLLEFFKRYRK